MSAMQGQEELYRGSTYPVSNPQWLLKLKRDHRKIRMAPPTPNRQTVSRDRTRKRGRITIQNSQNDKMIGTPEIENVMDTTPFTIRAYKKEKLE